MSLLDRLLDKLPADFFGSDVFVGYQGTYVWQANQLGHIAIGFIFASVFSWIFDEFQFCEFLFCVVCSAFVVLYAFKEFIDLRIAKKQAKGGPFELNKGELLCDMAADTWFVASGVSMAAAAHFVYWWGLVAFCVAFLAFFALRATFVPARKSLDRAGLPYMFRLCNFPETGAISCDDVKRIRAFVAGKSFGGHPSSPAILVRGDRGTGKTTLAVGIGTEVALHKKKGSYLRYRYLTAFSLFERDGKLDTSGTPLVERRIRRLLGTGDPWSLECAEVLIIDDVDSKNGILGGLKSAQILDKLRAQADICKLLRCKRTVWVVGTTSQYAGDTADHGWCAWHEALSEFYCCNSHSEWTGGKAQDGGAHKRIPVIWLKKPLV